MTPAGSGRTRLRLAAVCVLLTGLALVQSPGVLAPDTKLDLALAPGRFLSRAVHLWDPLAAGGQLQNQAYGYLWPMGPFFWAGHLLGMPDWAVQRFWLALVLCVAFLGAALLARALGVRSDLAVVVGGLAYALSPRMLTVLGPISIEAWPSALAPWVLLPLVIGSSRGSPRRAAALSALAVATVGGVNAAATFAVLPLGVLWLLTRTPGPRRRSMMLWWPVFTAVGTVWWLVPLFVLGAYSPPFLDFIESASTTTFPGTLFDALRGTSNWVPYIDTGSRAGNDLIRLPVLAMESGLVLLLGLAGLTLRRNPHRLFLALGVFSGLLLVTMGHLGAVQGWFAPGMRELLDGVLAPVRNVHKFDPILRLPLVIGLAWLVEVLWERVHAPGGDLSRHDLLALRIRLWAVITVTGFAVVGASLPALTGRITPAGGFTAVPDYWKQAAAWVAAESDEGQGQTLLVPGSSFGTYVWGAPHDEPMQSLARSRWLVRNAVPLTPPGNIRMLDAVEARFAQGLGSPGLAGFLRRAGVEFLLVRNDLTRTADIPDPVLVHQALADSPGLERVAVFGPDIGGEAVLSAVDSSGRILVNGGWQSEYPAIEIFAVAGDPAYAVQSSQPPTVVGGPEDLLSLQDLGVLGDEATVLASDVKTRAPGSRLVLTDGLRAVERSFGRVHDGVSATRTVGQERRVGNRTLDYLPATADRWLTTARTEGVRSVTASSSTADADAFGRVQPGQQPFAAIDGDPATAWHANYVGDDEAAWWEVAFTAPRSVDTVSVTAGPESQEVISVRTDHESTEPVTVTAGATVTIEVADARTSGLRVLDDSGIPGHRLSLAEVDVPGVQAQRWLQLPDVPESWGNPDDIVLRPVTDARRGCVEVESDIRCVPERMVTSEETGGLRRSFELDHAEDFSPALQVRARSGRAVAAAVMRSQPVTVTASSSAVRDPRASVLAAVDGDPRTTWSAAQDDERPRLALSWLKKQTVTGLQLSTARSSDVRVPRQLTLTWPGGRRAVTLDSSGEVRFPAIRTRSLQLQVEASDNAVSLDFASVASQVPVGITELRVLGLPYLPIAVPTNEVRLPCGSGPTLDVNGVLRRTSVRASLEQLYAGAQIPAKVCGAAPVSLQAGQNRVAIGDSELFAARSLVLSDGTPTSVSQQPVDAEVVGPSARAIAPAGPDGVVALRENSNPGWTARQGGELLDPVLVDGWQQGWRLEGSGPVTQRFTPDTPYRWGLFAGLTSLALLVAGVALGALRRRPARDVTVPPLGARGLAPAAAGGAVVVLGGLLAGWPGATVAGAAYVLGLVLDRKVRVGAAALLVGLVLPAALAYAVQPWGGDEGWAGRLAWPHYLVLAACSVLLVGVGERRPRQWRFLNRIAGSSTRR